MRFEDLEFKPILHSEGIFVKIEFPNGFGASVIRSEHSYGGSNGLYELAVTLNGQICYDTHITEDIVGFLKPEDITEYLEKIEKL